ncbi:uracil-DNA glycosylase [Acetobacter sp.]|jgi:uracil-DNA glycosylase|uniref:uracil-DNA glycosylase n=1 Tax=Acetobacter sp. TaxID=440 RepID=UPI0025C252D5|nr:uracil-DNA glycosylase [Acetobacter sp.]MCH4092226.1 uracil-DNA glycosylase [Acetobacter sp.]MCI1299857.1 uracil-DNA glycosylase [Acetobacter sp.]MCI1315875.1 uracil-DNA glycosylase [Acetobacter sp.]
MGVVTSSAVALSGTMDFTDNSAVCPRITLPGSSAGLSEQRLPFGPANASLLIVAPAFIHPQESDDPSHFDTQTETVFYEALVEAGFLSRSANENGDGALVPAKTRFISVIQSPPRSDLPLPSDVVACNHFLRTELQTLPNLRVVLTLGVLAHNATLAACGVPFSRVSFQNGQISSMPDGLRIANSLQLSRHNLQNGHLCQASFTKLLQDIRQEIDSPE